MSDNNDSKTVREEVLKLIERKELLEHEISELQKILVKNNVGMNDPLVDHEGFPLPNVDVYQVRHARHLLICKQNDHKGLMIQIEEGISEYYQDSALVENKKGCVTEEEANHSTSTSSDNREEITETSTIPFAIITIVHPGSPSHSAGIKDGDLLIEFGSVNASNYRGIDDIGNIVKHSHGTAINVKIKRASRFLRVHLIPREWNGRGLLGCTVNPF